MSLLSLLAGLCLLVGSVAGILGAIGLLRFPDFYTRLHPAGVTDTLCAGLILIGLMLLAGGAMAVIKLALILFFLMFTTPTATHALARAALNAGDVPLSGAEEGGP